MKKAIILFSLSLITFVVFGQLDSTVTMPQDPTNDWADWVARAFAILGILFPAWDAYKKPARDRAVKAQELFTRFVQLVDNNEFTNAQAFRELAAKGRDVIKKDE